MTLPHDSLLLEPRCVHCGLPWCLSGKESAGNVGHVCKRHGFNPWVEKIPWKRKQQPTSLFLPGKSHGQRSLVCYNSWGHKRVRHDLATKQQWWNKNCRNWMSGTCYNWNSCSEDRGATHRLGEPFPKIWVFPKWSEFKQMERSIKGILRKRWTFIPVFLKMMSISTAFKKR